jgi:hypothetical protein
MTQDFPALGLILLFPALGVLFNLFLGQRAGRGAVNLVGPGVVFIAFAVTLWGFFTLMGLPPGASLQCKLWPWIVAGSFHIEFGLRPRRALRRDDAHRDRGRRSDPSLLGRLHGRGRGLRALLHLHEPVPALDADTGAGRQPAPDVRRLGGRRPVLVPVDRVLVH